MIITDKDYLAFNITDIEKYHFVENYTIGDKEKKYDLEVRKARTMFAIKCMYDTPKNYIFTDNAQRCIDRIEVKDNIATREILFSVLEEKATLVLNKLCYFRYYRVGESTISVFFVGKETHSKITSLFTKGYNIYLGNRDCSDFDVYLQNFYKIIFFLNSPDTSFLKLNRSTLKEASKGRLSGTTYTNETSHDIIIAHQYSNELIKSVLPNNKRLI